VGEEDTHQLFVVSRPYTVELSRCATASARMPNFSFSHNMNCSTPFLKLNGASEVPRRKQCKHSAWNIARKLPRSYSAIMVLRWMWVAHQSPQCAAGKLGGAVNIQTLTNHIGLVSMAVTALRYYTRLVS
jgi:hypothetical protein